MCNRVEKRHLSYSLRDPCAALAAYFLCTDLRTKKMLQEFTHNNILLTIRINQHYMNKHFLSVP